MIARHHRNNEQPTPATKESGTEIFVEHLPAHDAREVDIVMGTLLLGYEHAYSQE